MAQKSDFTEQEWDQLRKGATGAGLLVLASDHSFFDSFKEAGSLAKHLAGGRSGSSELIRELASERGIGLRRRELRRRRSSPGRSRRSSRPSATLEAKAPDEVEAYKSFVLDLAESVREGRGRRRRGPRRPRSRRSARLSAELPRSPEAVERVVVDEPG